MFVNCLKKYKSMTIKRLKKEIYKSGLLQHDRYKYTHVHKLYFKTTIVNHSFNTFTVLSFFYFRKRENFGSILNISGKLRFNHSIVNNNSNNKT